MKGKGYLRELVIMGEKEVDGVSEMICVREGVSGGGEREGGAI